MCDMTQGSAWHDCLYCCSVCSATCLWYILTFICVTRLTIIRVTRLIYLCDMTHSIALASSPLDCVTWLTFTCVTRLTIIRVTPSTASACARLDSVAYDIHLKLLWQLSSAQLTVYTHTNTHAHEYTRTHTRERTHTHTHTWQHVDESLRREWQFRSDARQVLLGAAYPFLASPFFLLPAAPL